MYRKTITVFLADGEPTGSRIVEVSNWTGKAYIIPRSKIKTILEEPENAHDLTSQSVYILIGKCDKGEETIYIGEAEDCMNRLLQHNSNQDFWNTAIAILSKDDNLNKAHVKFLESQLISKALNEKRATVKNSTTPTPPKLSRTDKAMLEEFQQNIELMLSSLGYRFFEPLQQKESKRMEFVCESKFASAIGTISNEGFVIFNGSVLRGNVRGNLGEADRLYWNHLIETGVIVLNEDKSTGTLNQDILISSPSRAATLVLGRGANGWITWKTKDGETLDAIYRQGSSK
ncbi:MAG: GIY-YIG nuclease family protein [Patescibacteria group bacterium]